MGLGYILWVIIMDDWRIDCRKETKKNDTDQRKIAYMKELSNVSSITFF